MAVNRSFHNWSDHPHAEAAKRKQGSPALMQIRAYHLGRWGGRSLSSPSLWDPKPLGTKQSAHAGCAVDLRYQTPGPGREVVLTEMLPFYIGFSQELHIQAIHDYVGCRVWRANRSDDAAGGWKTQEHGSHDGKMGMDWAAWLHLEVTKDGWGDDRPVEEMLGLVVGNQIRRSSRTTSTRTPVPPPTFAPPFVTDLKAGKFGLYPLDRDKPPLSFGAVGHHVLYAQAVIFHRAGGAVQMDSRFGDQTLTRLLDVQRFFAMPETGQLDQATWSILDVLAGWVPNAAPGRRVTRGTREPAARGARVPGPR